MFAQAMQHHQRGEWLAADGCCRTILAREPHHVPSLNLLALLARQAGRLDEALTHLREVVRLAPSSALAHHRLGGTLVPAGRLEEAVPVLERAMALNRKTPEQGMPPEPESLFNLGYVYERLNKPDKAEALYRRSLVLKPDLAEAHNNLGALLLGQGRPKEASAQFARALVLLPQLLENFGELTSTLIKLNPGVGVAMQRAAAAWPRLLSIDELFEKQGLSAISGDAMLCAVLHSTTVRDIALERVLTSVRAGVLALAEGAQGDIDDETLGFACALARQCFNNEYVFVQSNEEAVQAVRIRNALSAGLANRQAVPPLWLAVVASYGPLTALPDAAMLLQTSWPPAVEALVTQQVREVAEERRLRDTVPRLTAIVDTVSTAVREQYEENPYPRWVLAPSARDAVTVDEYLAARFPMARHRPLGNRGGLDILVAGCGTGEHPIRVALRYLGARVLAVDLSLSSLCYAMRKTRELGIANIEYAQADLLDIGSLGRTFDVIDASGVLHHLADPAAGWRQLAALLRSDGLMRIGLYSEFGRADVVAARAFIAERGFQPTAADIRRCRQELLDTPQRGVAGFNDFFSTSEVRDLLFHVNEHRLTLPQIKQFLAAEHLRFIGFEVHAPSVQAYAARYPDDPAMADLDRWDALERARPTTFAGMYQFWCQTTR
jgi:tetratricopeptide (TPR) repeat protein/2-polyprenyl-3-methyl-5-hydroxy-6-metoxy-1,4-benzoquinol methylase